MNKIFKDDFYRNTGKNYNFINFVIFYFRCNQIRFLYWYRKNNFLSKFFLRKEMKKYHLEIFSKNIKEGLYIGHPYCITINENAIVGKNCNIHKGVTIGQENRGDRKGTPIIGDNVWIGINSTIVGKINIGNNVLIAPNSYVNRNIPDNSIVFGNPCIIKSDNDATKDYIINKV